MTALESADDCQCRETGDYWISTVTPDTVDIRHSRGCPVIAHGPSEELATGDETGEVVVVTHRP